MRCRITCAVTSGTSSRDSSRHARTCWSCATRPRPRGSARTPLPSGYPAPCCARTWVRPRLAQLRALYRSATRARTCAGSYGEDEELVLHSAARSKADARVIILKYRCVHYRASPEDSAERALRVASGAAAPRQGHCCQRSVRMYSMVGAPHALVISDARDHAPKCGDDDGRSNRALPLAVVQEMVRRRAAGNGFSSHNAVWMSGMTRLAAYHGAVKQDYEAVRSGRAAQWRRPGADPPNRDASPCSRFGGMPIDQVVPHLMRGRPERPNVQGTFPLPPSPPPALPAPPPALPAAQALSPSPPARGPPERVAVVARYPPGARCGGIDIYENDVQSCGPKRFLNDSVIDVLAMRLLRERTEPAVAARVHAFSTLMSAAVPANLEAREFWALRSWARRVDLFAKDLVFIPVNSDMHWSLVVVVRPHLLVKRALLARARRTCCGSAACATAIRTTRPTCRTRSVTSSPATSPRRAAGAAARARWPSRA